MALNQKKRSLVTLACLVAVAAGASLFAYYGVHQRQQKDEERKAQDEKLFGFEPAKVVGLTVQAKGETTRLARAKDGGGWGVISPVTAAADDQAIDGILERLSTMKRKAVVEEKAADLSRYGLQQPALKITAQLEDGSTRVLRAGADLKFDGSSYVAIDDSADVLQAEGGFRLALEKTTFDLRDKTIAPFDDTQVTGLSVRLGALRYVLKKENGVWRVLSPVADRADETTVNRLLGALRGLRAVAFQTDLANPVEEQLYRLDQPTFEAQLTLSNGQKLTVVASEVESEDGSKQGYARRKETTTIAQIAVTALQEFAVQEFDLRHKNVLDFAREKVAKVQLELGGESVTVERAQAADAGPSDEWKVVAPASAPAKKWKMSSMLWALGSLKASAFAAETAEDLTSFGLDQPARTLRLFGEDGRELATLLVGNEEGEKAFVKSAASPRVYEVTASALQELPRSRADVEEQPAADAGSPQ